jgi:hypothetical protein
MGVKITLLNGRDVRCADEELIWDDEAKSHTITKSIKDSDGKEWSTIIEIPHHAVATIEHFEKKEVNQNG